MFTLDKVFLILFCIVRLEIASAFPLSIKNSDCACRSGKTTDSLEDPLSYNFGKFNGQCIDSCRFRPTRIIHSEYKKIKVGNVLHRGIFRSGVISLDDIKGVDAGFEEFMPGIYHVFLKFHFFEGNPPLQFFSQIEPHQPAIETRTLVLSPEAAPPKNHKYNLIDAFLGHYLLVNRLVTGEEMERWASKYKHQVKFFPLQLSPEQASKILLRGVQESNQLMFENNYQLFTNNCSTSAFALIDFAIGNTANTGSVWSRFEEALPIAGPIGTLHALTVRGLVSTPQAFTNQTKKVLTSH